MTPEQLSENLANYVDTYGNAFLIGEYGKKVVVYCNKKAEDFYGITTDNTDLEPIFKNNPHGLMDMTLSGLKDNDLFVCNNIITTTPNGKSQIADIQISFFNPEKTLICIEIIPKEDVRLNMAISQVDHSMRAEGIFLLDEKLTLVHCNDLFHQVFESNTEIADSHYDKHLANGFQPEIREELLANIHKTLENETTFSSKIKVITTSGKEHWYSIEMQKRTLDDSGMDKILVYMVNIEDEVRKEKKTDTINRIFTALLDLSDDCLFVVNIEQRTMESHDPKVKNNGFSEIIPHFPESIINSGYIYQEDIPIYRDFADSVLHGKSGSKVIRLQLPDGTLKHRKFTWSPVILEDGSVEEVIGNTVDIEDLVETKKELDGISQYFNILQDLCKGLLYRFDVKTRTIYRSPETAKIYGVPEKAENFPSPEWLSQVMPEEDRQRFTEFMDKVSSGVEGSCEAGLRVPSGEQEHHRFTFKAIRNADGSVKEMVGCATNIHNLKETQKELAGMIGEFEAIERLSDDMLFKVDLRTKTMYRTSEQAEKLGLKKVMTNYPDSIVEQGVIHQDDVKIYLEYAHKLLNGTSNQAEVRFLSQNGESTYRRLSCTPVYDTDGQVNEMFGKIVNVQKVRDLEEQANYDSLTKTLNKRAMLESTSQILSRAMPDSRHALFFMDLDDFKYVNDNLGHAFGDFLLGELGQRLKDGVRFHDLVGRVGGDEFVIFLRDVPNVDMLMGKAKMLLSTISEDFSDGTTHHNIHGSLGIAVFPDHGTSYEELYHHADLALYSSKHKGKNLVTLYTPDLKDSKDNN